MASVIFAVQDRPNTPCPSWLMPSMPELYKNRGMLSISSLKAYIAYALKEEDGDTFVKPKEGMEMADKLIEESGYLAVNEAVVTAIQRDCPFLFPAD